MTKLFVTCVFAFSSFVLFYNLDGHYLVDWDEAWYVLMAQRAIEDGNYLFLRFQNQVFWDKSPFTIYPMMLSFKIFGITEATARLPSAIFGLGVMIQIFLLARKFYGPVAGALAVLIAVTSTQFIFLHGLRTANIDGITIFFVTGSLSCWFLIERPAARVAGTFASLGLAFLCKGPIIVIPLAVVALNLLVGNPLKGRMLKSFMTALLTMLVIVVPWYAYMYVAFGRVFIQNHILRNFLERYTVGLDHHTYGDMYFTGVLLSPENFLWYGVGMLGFFYFFKLYAEEKNPAHLALISWVFTTYIIVNLSHTKLAWYIFPLYPPLAIMAAKTLDDFIGKKNYLNIAAFYFGSIIILAAYLNREIFPEHNAPNIARACIVCLGLFCIDTLIEKKLPEYRKAFSTLLVCLLFLYPAYRSYDLAGYTSRDAPIHSIAERVEQNSTIATFLLYNPGASYYLSKKGILQEFFSYDDFPKLRGRVVITTKDALKGLNKDVPDGPFPYTFQGEHYTVTPLFSADVFSMVKVE